MYVDINIQTLEIHSRDLMVFGLIHFFKFMLCWLIIQPKLMIFLTAASSAVVSIKKNAYYSYIFQVKEK
jgi:hypothetical protein